MYCQAYTLYSSVRPFGLSVLLGGVDPDGTPGLYCIEPSGVFWVRSPLFAGHSAYPGRCQSTGLPSRGHRQGQDAGQDGDREVEARGDDCPRSGRRARPNVRPFPGQHKAADQADRQRHRIHQVHDDVKDKEFELELSWCSTSETKGRHQLVPEAIVAEASRKAKEALNADEEMED